MILFFRLQHEKIVALCFIYEIYLRRSGGGVPPPAESPSAGSSGTFSQSLTQWMI